MMMKNDISSLESTGIQKKCLGLTPIFFHGVYPKDHKIAHMEKFDVYLGEKFHFLYIIYEIKLTFLEKEVL